MNMYDAQIARQWVEAWAEEPTNDMLAAVYRHILATTTPLTMADVEWDNDVHQGLCAEHPDRGLVRMIAPAEEVGIYVLFQAGVEILTGWESSQRLTPIPGTKIDITPRRAPVSNEDYKSGRAVDFDDKTLLPRPQDVPVGEVWEVEAVGYGKWAGTRSNPGNSNAPWTLIRVDSSDYYWANDDQVTLIRRLVPDTAPDHPDTLSSVEDYESAPVGTVVEYDGDVAVKRDDSQWQWTGRISRFWSEDFAEADPCTVVRWGK